MAGIRIVHQDPRKANTVVVIQHPYQPFAQAMLCPTCNVLHRTKHYHLPLDEKASIVVSETVFKNLKDLGLPNLMVESEIEKPPATRIDFNKKLPQEQIVREKPRIQLRNVGV